jgi:hypothetical protein
MRQVALSQELDLNEIKSLIAGTCQAMRLSGNRA